MNFVPNHATCNSLQYDGSGMDWWEVQGFCWVFFLFFLDFST